MLWYQMNQLSDFMYTLWNTAVTNVSVYNKMIVNKPWNSFEVCGIPQTLLNFETKQFIHKIFYLISMSVCNPRPLK
jgi:hypothetical protein